MSRIPVLEFYGGPDDGQRSTCIQAGIRLMRDGGYYQAEFRGAFDGTLTGNYGFFWHPEADFSKPKESWQE